MKDNIDLLKKVEDLTARMNQIFGEKGRGVFGRYPLTFAILIFFGVIMITDGMKELIKKIPFLKESPFLMLAIGIMILIITGSLYKKLNKGE